MNGLHVIPRIWLWFLVFAIAGCGPTMQVSRHDPNTGEVGSTRAAPWFEVRTLLVPGRIGLHLVVDLEKKGTLGRAQTKRSTGMLENEDLDASGLFTAYVHNLTDQPQFLTIAVMSHNGQAVHGAPLVISLRPDAYEKVVLGRVGISRHAADLEIEMVYKADAEAMTRTLLARRLTQSEINADVKAWKGKKKNVPEFFVGSGEAARLGRELTFHDAPYWVTVTIPKSRDTFKAGAVSFGNFPGGRVVAEIAFTPHGGGPPNSSVSLYVYDRGGNPDWMENLPRDPTLQEFLAEYQSHQEFYSPMFFRQRQIGDVSEVKLGDRTWFKFRVMNDSVQYWTPLDGKKMLALRWTPPSDSFLWINKEAEKRLEIESMLSSVRVSRDP